MISICIFLTLVILALLDSIGRVSLKAAINGPAPEQTYLPGLLISLGIFCLTILAAIIASMPVAKGLQAEGSLYSHSLKMIIVVIFITFLTIGLGCLIIDRCLVSWVFQDATRNFFPKNKWPYLSGKYAEINAPIITQSGGIEPFSISFQLIIFENLKHPGVLFTVIFINQSGAL